MDTSSDRREFALLLLASRVAPDAPQIRALVAQGIDWSIFSDLAARHRVRPLVIASLRAACWESIPIAVRDQWNSVSRSLAAGGLMLVAELLRITAAFADAGVFVAVMKGPVMAAMLYGDFTLREYEDIDLLIQPDDFSRALAILTRLGYQSAWTGTDSRALHFLRRLGELTLTNPARRSTVDLHWRVSPTTAALAPRIADFPSGFQPFPLADATVRTFAAADLPLYLATQGGWDCWNDLRRVCDLAEFLRRFPHTDWDSLLCAAASRNGLRSMLVGLSLAATLLDAPIPSSASAHLRDDATARHLAALASAALREDSRAWDGLNRYRFQWKAKAGAGAKLALAFNILTDRTWNDSQWVMIPRPLWWFYGLLRPLRVGLARLHR